MAAIHNEGQTKVKQFVGSCGWGWTAMNYKSTIMNNLRSPIVSISGVDAVDAKSRSWSSDGFSGSLELVFDAPFPHPQPKARKAAKATRWDKTCSSAAAGKSRSSSFHWWSQKTTSARAGIPLSSSVVAQLIHLSIMIKFALSPFINLSSSFYCLLCVNLDLNLFPPYRSSLLSSSSKKRRARREYEH